jgi:hypothetical protein
MHPLQSRPYADFRVPFVMGGVRADATEPRARLDGVESALGSLVSRWNAGRPLSVSRDVRMTQSTLDGLITWIAGEEVLDAGFVERLGIYRSGAVADPAVPGGWIRVYLGLEQRQPERIWSERG